MLEHGGPDAPANETDCSMCAGTCVEPQEAPGLTDDEIEASVRSDRRPGTFFDRIDFARAVIAADRAKRGGA